MPYSTFLPSVDSGNGYGVLPEVTATPDGSYEPVYDDNGDLIYSVPAGSALEVYSDGGYDWYGDNGELIYSSPGGYDDWNGGAIEPGMECGNDNNYCLGDCLESVQGWARCTCDSVFC